MSLENCLEGVGSMSKIDYLIKKREEVLKEIQPICDTFNIKCDYLVSEEGQRETLILNGQKIGCSMNSLYAIKNEIIGYIFATIYCHDKSWYHKPQTLKYVKKYWLK